MNPFLTERVALTLDALGHRYGAFPSVIVGISPLSGKGLLFNIKVLGIALSQNENTDTVMGQIRAKQRQWPSWAKRELKQWR